MTLGYNVSNDLFVDCTYIGINSSPRSDTLPKFYGIEILDFNLGVNIKTTIPNLFKIMPRLSELKAPTNKVLIEYDGNFLLNFLLVLRLGNAFCLVVLSLGSFDLVIS